MLDTIILSLSTYYGLDWLALFTGFIGMYLITQKKQIGFLVSSVSCLSGFTVALISMQFGFVFYNIILIALMLKGYAEWNEDEKAGSKGTASS